MANNELTAQQRRLIAEKERRTLTMQAFISKVNEKRGDLAKILPNGMSVDRFAKVVLSRVSRNPELLECTPSSLYLGAWQAAELGLELMGPMEHCYLVARRNTNLGGAKEANFMLGYRGLIELAQRSGAIEKLDANVVFEGEKATFRFDPQSGRIEHPYSFDVERTPDKVIGAYAWCRLKGVADPITRILNRKQIDEAKSRSASQSGPWATDYCAMAQKTALRRLLRSGLIPLQTDDLRRLRQAMDRDADRDPDEVRTTTFEVSDSVLGALPDTEAVDYTRYPDAVDSIGAPIEGDAQSEGGRDDE